MRSIRIFLKKIVPEDWRRLLDDVNRFSQAKFYELLCHMWSGHYVRQHRIKRYFESHATRKIQFGCGVRKVPGFLNSDLFGEIPINICRRLPFPDESVDLIYSNHVVEHVYEEDFKSFLRESFRVLKIRGCNIIAVPTIRKAVANVYGGDKTVLATLMELDLKFMNNSFVNPSTYLNHLFRWWDHKWLYDEDVIRHHADEAAYQSMEKVANLEIPDEDLRSYLIGEASARWALETETFVLRK